MDRAAGADPHRGSPDPAERVHHTPDCGFVDAGAGVALAAFSGAGALVDGGAVHEIIDVLVGETRGDGDGADYAVAGFAAVPGCGASAVMESEVLRHARSWAGGSVGATGQALASDAASGSTGLSVVTRRASIFRPLFMSKRCLRSRLLTNSRVALPMAPEMLEASILMVRLSGADFAVFVLQCDVVGVHSGLFLLSRFQFSHFRGSPCPVEAPGSSLTTNGGALKGGDSKSQLGPADDHAGDVVVLGSGADELVEQRMMLERVSGGAFLTRELDRWRAGGLRRIRCGARPGPR